jgi:hypothetical protein
MELFHPRIESGRLERNPGSRKIPFYYFSTTFGGFDLPLFAAFCRVMNFILGSAGQN